MTGEAEEIIKSLRDAIAEVEAAKDGTPIAMVLAVAYALRDGNGIGVTAETRGFEIGIVTAMDGLCMAVDEVLDLDEDDEDEAPEERRPH